MQTGPADKPIPQRRKRVAKKVPRPAPSEVKDTKSNADRARSQPTVTRELKRIATKHAQVKDTKGNADRVPEKHRQKIVNQAMADLANHVIEHPQDYKGTPLAKNLEKRGLITSVGGFPAKGELLLAADSAPVLHVLDQTLRPLHAIAGAADAAVTGKNVLKAAKRGAQNKDHTTFSDVLKHAGAPKVVQTVGGFGLDVVADPTTYLTAGTAGVLRNAAAKAARDAERKALKAGLSPAQAKRFGDRAAKQAGTDEGAKGLTVKFAGHELPGVTKATAPAGKVLRKAGNNPVSRGVRGVAADFNPNMAPTGATRAQLDEATSAARTTRAKTQRATHATQQKAVALRKALGKDDAQVVDAIETGRINSLPAHLQPAAKTLSQHYGQIRKLEKRAGIPGATIGERRRFVVPEVTADTEASARRLRDAISERARQERTHQDALAGFGVARGRAQVLSRNVGGVSAEKKAQALTVPKGENQFAGGGRGVMAAARGLEQSGKNLAAAREAVAKAEEHHRATVKLAHQQRVVRGRALKVKSKLDNGPAAYVPHHTAESLQARAPSEHVGSVGKKVIRPGPSKARKEGTLAEKSAANPDVYNQDAALGFLNRMVEGHRSVGQAELNRRIADAIGRPVKAGRDLSFDPATEAVYHLKGSDLVPVTDAKELERIATHGHAGKGGRYVVVHKDLVTRAHAIAAPSGNRSSTGRTVDALTGWFKLIATQPNPGFHIRNLVGDTHNAYTAQRGSRLAVNLAQSGKALRGLKRDEEALRTLGKDAKPLGRGLLGKSTKVDGRDMTYAELAHEAAGVGAIRSGFTNQELPELISAQGKGAKRVARNIPGASRAWRAVKRTAQSREDLPRLSTYIEGRKLGMNPEEASRFTMAPHFDYANLTAVERKVRRAVPFYTFSARNIPYQAKVLVTKPGKVATYEKIREEAAKAAGLEPGWESDLTPWEQRNAGIPFRINGKVHVISFGSPITDLNEFPVDLLTGHPTKQLDEWMKKAASLVSPIFKDPVEIWANYSFFFRDQIRRKNAPLVAAPNFVSTFPEWAKRAMHVTKIIDKRTGKPVWAWDAYANYYAHAVPGPVNTAMSLLSGGSDRSGRESPEKVAGALGVKSTPLDATTTKINDLYDQLDSIQTELGALSQRGIKAGDPRRDKLNALSRKIEQDVYKLSVKRGDKVPPTAGRPPRKRLVHSNGGLGDSLGGGLGGGI